MMRTNRTARRAMSLGVSLFVLTALTGLAAVGTEWAHLQMVKSQMQTTVDAAARAGAAGLSKNTHVSYAKTTASKNTVRNEPMSLADAEVKVVNRTWNAAPRQAVEVSVSRDVPLFFGRVFQRDTATVRAKAVAMKTPGKVPYGVIAINGIDMRGSDRIDSYDSTQSGQPTFGSKAAVATMGRWYNFDGNASIMGDLHYVLGQPNKASAVTGTRSVVDPSVFDLPISTLPPTFAATFGNQNLSGNDVLGNRTLGSGDYLIDGSLNLGGNSLIRIEPAPGKPVRLFIKGDLTIHGNHRVIAPDIDPADLEIHMVSPAGVNINGHHQMTAVLYAPASPLNMNGGPDIFGSVVVKQLSMSGNAGIHMDEALESTRGGRIVLVE